MIRFAVLCWAWVALLFALGLSLGLLLIGNAIPFRDLSRAFLCLACFYGPVVAFITYRNPDR